MHAVILDIDGTLLDSAEEDDRLYREAVREVLGPVRLRPGLHDYDPVTDTGILRQIASDNGIDFDTALLLAVQDRFVSRVNDFIETQGPFRPLPGAIKFIDSLRASPLAAAALATGGWRATASLKLDTAGFDIGGLPLKASDDADTRTGIMRVALDSLEGPFESVTYLGDGAWDRTATRQMGWRFQPVGDAIGGIRAFGQLAGDPGWQWLDFSMADIHEAD
jgi:phosphoglycolate phosphatase-like HAD superfamily hydrolase